MNRFSRDLAQGMKEAAEFAEGRKAGARVHVVEVPDVRAIRPASVRERPRPGRRQSTKRGGTDE